MREYSDHHLSYLEVTIIRVLLTTHYISSVFCEASGSHAPHVMQMHMVMVNERIPEKCIMAVHKCSCAFSHDSWHKCSSNSLSNNQQSSMVLLNNNVYCKWCLFSAKFSLCCLSFAVCVAFYTKGLHWEHDDDNNARVEDLRLKLSVRVYHVSHWSVCQRSALHLVFSANAN